MDKYELGKIVKEAEGLSNEVKSELLKYLHSHKKFGLVWEDKPEEVEQRMLEKLPVLTEVKDKAIISEDKNAPNHILIEGDNLQVLTTLAYTHEGKIDVIYIDPPYNTGKNDFVYNDKMIDKENEYRHSMWLSFMVKRLKLAKQLLSANGVIFISIDDNEQANLKVLCDEVFGSQNFISTMIWQAGKKSSGNLVGVNHEYLLVYAKMRSLIDKPEFAWEQRKLGLEKIYYAYNKLKSKYKDDYKKIEEGMNDFFKALPENDPAYNSKHYRRVDARGLYFADNSCAPDRPETRCHKPLIHPITHKPTAVPSLGWRWKESTLDKMVEEDLIYYGEDETHIPQVKKYLKDMETELPTSVFYKDGRGATAELASILGDGVFQNPKDRNEIQRILNFRPNAIILDFFAGSGTTLHATMELNKNDKGSRQCILVQAPETTYEYKNGEYKAKKGCETAFSLGYKHIAEITYERNQRVIKGYATPKGNEVAGLSNNNLRYYKTDFVPRDQTTKNMRELMSRATDMLCIKNNIYTAAKFAGKDIHPDLLRYFENDEKQMLVIYNEEAIHAIVSLMQTIEPRDEKMLVYVFSPSSDPWSDDFEDVAGRVKLCALPSAILETYKKILPKRKPKFLDEALAELQREAEEQGELFNQEEEA